MWWRQVDHFKVVFIARGPFALEGQGVDGEAGERERGREREGEKRGKGEGSETDRETDRETGRNKYHHCIQCYLLI